MNRRRIDNTHNDRPVCTNNLPLQLSVNIPFSLFQIFKFKFLFHLSCIHFKDITKALKHSWNNGEYKPTIRPGNQAVKGYFHQKTKDYGTAWRVLRTISVVDQIFIKALRIRTIQDLNTQKVEDDIASNSRVSLIML